MGKDDSANILVVDDEQDVSELIARWLASKGYSCTTTSTGEAAISLMEKDTFDLIIADIMMPGMSGVISLLL